MCTIYSFLRHPCKRSRYPSSILFPLLNFRKKGKSGPRDPSHSSGTRSWRPRSSELHGTHTRGRRNLRRPLHLLVRALLLFLTARMAPQWVNSPMFCCRSVVHVDSKRYHSGCSCALVFSSRVHSWKMGPGPFAYMQFY